ncbi:MAG: hypothetical protein ACLUVF_09675 [Adlercreutzia sp.]
MLSMRGLPEGVPHGALTTAAPARHRPGALPPLRMLPRLLPGAVTRPYELYQLKKGRRLL